MKDYADRIRELREDNEITQHEIAIILGIKQSGYSKYEKRRTKMQIEDLIKLCEFYNVTADYILGLTDEMRPLRSKKPNL